MNIILSTWTVMKRAHLPTFNPILDTSFEINEKYNGTIVQEETDDDEEVTEPFSE